MFAKLATPLVVAAVLLSGASATPIRRQTVPSTPGSSGVVPAFGGSGSGSVPSSFGSVTPSFGGSSGSVTPSFGSGSPSFGSSSPSFSADATNAHLAAATSATHDDSTLDAAEEDHSRAKTVDSITPNGITHTSVATTDHASAVHDGHRVSSATSVTEVDLSQFSESLTDFYDFYGGSFVRTNFDDVSITSTVVSQEVDIRIVQQRIQILQECIYHVAFSLLPSREAQISILEQIQAGFEVVQSRVYANEVVSVDIDSIRRFSSLIIDSESGTVSTNDFQFNGLELGTSGALGYTGFTQTSETSVQETFTQISEVHESVTQSLDF